MHLGPPKSVLMERAREADISKCHWLAGVTLAKVAAGSSVGWCATGSSVGWCAIGVAANATHMKFLIGSRILTIGEDKQHQTSKARQFEGRTGGRTQ